MRARQFLILMLSLGLAGALSADTASDGPANGDVPQFSPDAGAQLEQDRVATAQFKNLDQEIQDLKKVVLDLNRDLFLLEEELLFPANTQVAVFISMDVGDFFDLDSVTVKLNDKEVSNYLYTTREVEALVRGGVHRLFLGNMKVGEHELVAIFSGKGPHQRDYKRGATVRFEKGIGPKFVELQISDKQRKQQPEFVVKEWE